MIEDRTALPEGWEWREIRDVTHEVPNVDPRRTPNKSFSYIDISSIDNERLVVTNAKPLTGREAPSRARRPVQPGDVVFSNVRTYLRNVARISGSFEPAVASTGFTVLRPTDAVTTDFLFRYVASDGFLELITPRQTGTQYPATSDRVVRSQAIPIPPVQEQRRITAWLDEIEARRAATADRLATARAIIDRLRTAVLAAACSGRLTADWRGADADAGGEGPINTLDGAIDLLLPGLPASYNVSTMGAVSERIEYGTSKKADTEGDVPVLRMGNIQDGRIDTNDLKYLPLDGEVERLLLDDGDLLFNRTNSPDLVGKTAVFHRYEPATFASYLIRVRFQKELIEPDFVGMWLNSAWGRAWARHVKTDGVSQSNINGTKLAAMPLPLPPLAEQHEIVRRATGALEAADRLKSAIAVATEALDRAMKGATAKAFSGELVTE